MLDLSKVSNGSSLLEELQLQKLTPLERYIQDPKLWRFREIPKSEQTPELVKSAVLRDGLCLCSVSKKLITADLCKDAVLQNGCALQYVPQKFLSENLCQIAVERSAFAIQYVPEIFLTQRLCLSAVKSSGNTIKYIPEKFITSEMVNIAVSYAASIKNEWDYAPIAYVPYVYLNAELVMRSVQNTPRSLKNIYQKFMSKKLLHEAVTRDGTAIEFVPEKKITYELIELAVSNNPHAWNLIPDSEKTSTVKAKLEAKFPTLFETLQAENDIQAITEANQLSIGTDDEESNEYVQFSLMAPSLKTPKIVENGFKQVTHYRSQMLCHFGANDDHTLIPIYYISDIHLEHQLQPIIHENMTIQEIEYYIDKNIKSMVKGIDTDNGILLIAGDVANSIELTRLFYCCLRKIWSGRIFGVLGNHELWDGHSDETTVTYKSRTLEQIINDYCDRNQYWNLHIMPPSILQNALFVCYKNQTDRILFEDLIMTASPQELSELCQNSTLIILGGIGFSGQNPYYNAELGLYRGTVPSLNEDKKQSEKFLNLYRKVNECAGNQRVIVLTHTPVRDWSNEPYNPNWIYINGHTHINALIRKSDGTTVLSDNQIGYVPHKWKLSGFTMSGWYDPLSQYEDGIYKISSNMYADFNIGRGISSNGCNYEGEIYALKRKSIYIFLLKGKASLCLLEGGRRHRLKNQDITYYYDNMLEYYQRVMETIKPYHNAIKLISDEVRQFGGDGTIHGCIVDITFFSHLYLNPFDGKISIYWAYDIGSRQIYNTISELLQEREPYLLKKYIKSSKKGDIPLLSKYASEKAEDIQERKTLATIPRIAFGTEIYDPSRIMRSIQYVFDQNVIRIWKDEVLKAESRNLNNENRKLLSN